jgi:hypothetical protein
MRKQEFVGWLRKKVPRDLWEQVWWQLPIIMLLMLPVGALVLHILGRIGWYGAAEATQALMVISVFGGVVVGSIILWCIEEAGLPPLIARRAKWLAGLSIPGPLLTLLLMFWIASIR